jgi:hypothetical protein
MHPLLMDQVIIWLIKKLDKQKKEAKTSLESAKAYLAHVECCNRRAEKIILTYGKAMYIRSALAYHTRKARSLVDRHMHD